MKCMNSKCRKKARIKLGTIYNPFKHKTEQGQFCSISCAKEYFKYHIGDIGFKPDKHEEVFVNAKNRY